MASLMIRWVAMGLMAVVVPLIQGSGPGVATADDYLFQAPVLNEGDSMSSGWNLGGEFNGAYDLDLQHDCNLVLHPYNSGQQIWTSNTGGQANDCTLVMQYDCNAVLYVTGTQTALWATGTAGHGSGCQFTVQADGNVVVYDGNGVALWSTGTNRMSTHGH